MYELKRSVKNRARVEGSICQGYLLSEITNICSMYYGSEVETRYNRLNRNEATLNGDFSGQLSIFHKRGTPIGAVQEERYLSGLEYDQIELYTAMNCPEMDGWYR